MTTYHIWAEHTSGQSVGHPCTTGVFSDPTDQFSEVVEAESEAAAEEMGRKLLAKIVEESEPCSCQRHWQAGSNSWWGGVAIIASRAAYPKYVGDDSAEEESDDE